MNKTNAEKLDDLNNNLKKYNRSNFASTLNPKLNKGGTDKESVYSSGSKIFNRNYGCQYKTLDARTYPKAKKHDLDENHEVDLEEA